MITFIYFYAYLWIFILGACIGSFLNVCICRMPEEESIVWPGSHCPSCQTPIAWYDNLPIISYIRLWGHCRHCHTVISPRYLVVEVLTATLFLLIYFRFGLAVTTAIYWLFCAAMIIATFVDFEHTIIPDTVTIGGILVGLLLSVCFPQLHPNAQPSSMMMYNTMAKWSIDWNLHLRALLSSGFSAALGFGILWLVRFIGQLVYKQEAMGFGDVKLLGAIGAFLGWRAVLFTIVVSSFLGTIVGVMLIIACGQGWRSKIPYGPYLATAALIWILSGPELIDIYISWMQSRML